MTPSEAKQALARLCQEATSAAEVAKTAQRSKQSLRGDGHYGRKYHDHIVTLTAQLARLGPTFTRLTEHGAKDGCTDFQSAVETLKSLDADASTRLSALKRMRLACEGTLYPLLDTLTAPAIPANEHVLLSAVVKGTRGYYERVIQQANGCYEKGWTDAAAVMIRKFVEILIIDVYEHAKRADEIKGSDGNFYMLSGLVDKILNDKAFNLGRETKTALPLIKALGDRSAHNRRYLATTDDVNKVTPGLRVVADELLHLAGMK